MFRASRPLLAVTAIAVALTASGCTTPAPAPTPTGFASEEEAFAAAEATYRAYVDALNRVDLSDPETFEEVFRYTTGELNSSDRKSLSAMHADELTVTGETVVAEFWGEVFDSEPSSLIATACSDVSGVSVTNAAGVSQVPPGRGDMYEITLHFVAASQSPFGLQIERTETGAPERCEP